jgi:hypothetical protein
VPNVSASDSTKLSLTDSENASLRLRPREKLAQRQDRARRNGRACPIAVAKLDRLSRDVRSTSPAGHA